MRLTFLRCRHFRNLEALHWPVPPGVILVTGANGSGKSSLLEAVAVLGNLSSFRPSQPHHWLRHGQSSYYLRGELTGPAGTIVLEQEGKLGKTFVRQLRRNGQRVATGEYLRLFPVASFSATDHQLVLGGPELRRRFLDRLAFLLQPNILDTLLRYRRALRQRNRLLQLGQEGPALEAFERELAHTGALIVASRLSALESLRRALEEELAALGWLLPKPFLRYHAPDGLALSPASQSQLLALLRRWRPQETRRGHTLVGPHRHELCLSLHGRPAREQLSAGQSKVLATALRLAALAASRASLASRPLVVFDDVDAELDSDTLAKLLQRLVQVSQQVFLASAHPQVVLPHLDEATVVRMERGALNQERKE